MVKLINSDPTVLDALVTCDESLIYCYNPETKRQSSQWKHASSPRAKKARQSKSTHKLLMIPFFNSTGMIYMHWVLTGQTVNKEYYVQVLREFRERLRRKRPALFKSGQRHFHQDNAPVHNSILVTDYLSKMGIKTISHPPCDFWLFPKLKENIRGCHYETIEEMKEAVMRSLTCSHKKTSTRPSRSCWNGTASALQPEEILQRGLEFHVRTINKSAHTKMSGNFLCAPCIYIYISLCTYIFLYTYMYIHPRTKT